MRILLLHQYFLEDDDAGGSRWNELSRLWTEAGHEVTVLAGMVHYMGKRPTHYKGKYFYPTHNKDGVRVIRCHVSDSYNSNFLGRLWAYFSFTFSSTWAGIRYARADYDLIVVTSPPLFVGITAVILSALKRIPFVFEIRDLWPESAIDTGVLRSGLLIRLAYWFESYVYRKAALINVLTPAFRRVLIAQKNVPPSKIIEIPNAADFALSETLLHDFDAEAFRREVGFEEYFVITYVGAHGVANQLEQLLEAAARLQDTPVLFVLIGDGMRKPALVAQAQALGLTNVRFLDPVPKKEVFRYILASDMGASVLKNVETFKTVYSNKTFDYFSCKKPVLMAIDGVSRELVEAAEAGFYVTPEDATGWEVKVRFCIQHPELLAHMGENGYRYARLHFDRTLLACRYLDALKNCVNNA